MDYLDERFDKGNEYFRKLRSVCFKPILDLMICWKINANFLSSTKILFAVGFTYFLNQNLVIAFSLLMMIFIVDIFDGPLARQSKQDSDRGKFIDMFTDYVAYVVIVWGFIMGEFISTSVLSYNMLILPILYLIIIIRKNEDQPSDWVIKPVARVSYYKTICLFGLFFTFFGYMSKFVFQNGVYILNILMTLQASYHYIMFIKQKPPRKIFPSN